MTWPRSLQGRLLLTVLGLVAGVWVAAVALTGLDARHELDELLDSHLAQAAALLVARQAGDMEAEAGEHEVDAPSLHRYAPKVAFQVFHSRAGARGPVGCAGWVAGAGRLGRRCSRRASSQRRTLCLSFRKHLPALIFLKLGKGQLPTIRK
jgi:hypothetical protein